MRFSNILASSVSVFAVTAAAPSFAQDFYAGLGYASGGFENQYGAKTTLTFMSLIGGVDYSTGGALHYGAEIQLGTALSEDVPLDDSMVQARLRGIVGYDLGQFDLYATAGLVAVRGYMQLDETMNTGFTYGLGAAFDVSDKVTLRIEATQDRINSGSGDYVWDGTTVGASAVFSF